MSKYRTGSMVVWRDIAGKLKQDSGDFLHPLHSFNLCPNYV